MENKTIFEVNFTNPISKKDVNINFTREDVCDMTAQNFFANAVLSLLETKVFGLDFPLIEYTTQLTYQESLDSRVFGTTLALAGFSKVYAKGQDFSREKFNIDLKTSSEGLVTLHDSLYCGVYSTIFSAVLYSLTTDMNFVNEIVPSSALIGVVALPLGRVISYNMDSFRDFLGFKENPKLFKPIKRLNKTKKLGLAGLLLTGYLTSTYYTLDKLDNLEFNFPLEKQVTQLYEKIITK
ncbi:MAG: hypothetical protein HRU03_01830 [Nanoarchaeales archaeon]|nr:hypothetical protein [Nanoarchaeales archaeon]